MKKHMEYSLLGLLLLGVIFIRIYHIDSIPLGMHIDEAGLGLNAWSLANFGTDRYGHFMPVCPSNFYGEQSAFYTYFCALLVKFWGLNMYTLRLPGVIMGIVAVIFGALLMREKWGKPGFYIGLALLGIFPYFVMNCRFALDCNAMLGCVTVALYGLVRLLKEAKTAPRKKLYGKFALVGVLFGITLYTYIIAAIVIALFCFFFGLYYLLCQKEGRLLRFRQLLCMALPICLMVLPLLLVVCVNYFDWEPITTPFFSIPKLITDRTQEVAFTFADLPRKLRALLYPFTSDGIYGSSDRYLTMYPWSIPLCLLGIFASFRESIGSFRAQKICADYCIIVFAAAQVIMFLFCGQYNYHINGIFIALAYFCLSGIFFSFKILKTRALRIGYGALLIILYSLSFTGFCREYFGADTTSAFQVYGGVEEILSLLPKSQQDKKIYIMDEVGEFYLLSNPLSPEELAPTLDDLGYIRHYRNLHFHDPETYTEDAVYVCNKSSGKNYPLSDPSYTGQTLTFLETEYYYLFYNANER